MSPSERGKDVTDRLAKGEKLVRGQSLTSKNGAYTLTLQDDGNLVLTAGGAAVWATGTDGQNAERLEVQKDGNTVLYTPDKPIWHTDTKGAKDVRLILQDDRNLVLYGFDGPAWSSNTQTDEAPPPPAGAEAETPEVAPAAAEEPLAPAPPPPPSATAASCSADLHRGVWRHAVGHLRAVLRRRQQVPADRRRQWHQQPRPDSSGTGADDSVAEVTTGQTGPNDPVCPAVCTRAGRVVGH